MHFLKNIQPNIITVLFLLSFTVCTFKKYMLPAFFLQKKISSRPRGFENRNWFDLEV